jgi:hypothetical protein
MKTDGGCDDEGERESVQDVDNREGLERSFLMWMDPARSEMAGGNT